MGIKEGWIDTVGYCTKGGYIIIKQRGRYSIHQIEGMVDVNPCYGETIATLKVLDLAKQYVENRLKRN